MICNNCKKEIPDNVSYCPNCGAPQKQMENPAWDSLLKTGLILGIVSLGCAILGLGSFGILDIIAIICGIYGKKQLKKIPKDLPNWNLAMTLNKAGIICSAAFIVIIIVVCLVAAPGVFLLFGKLFSSLAAAFAAI